MTRHKLIIAGGGTGGHVFPAISIGEEWRKRGHEVVFVGTPKGLEGDLIPKNGFELRLITVGQIKGQGLVTKLKTIFSLPSAVMAARRILKTEKPDVVLSVGGYAAGPLCLAAKFLGLPLAVAEQNAQPGITNRVLGKLAKRVFVSFAGTEHFFCVARTRLTGNPIRAKITHTSYTAPGDVFRILIVGGSQGAVTMNQLATEALVLLPDLHHKLRVQHQAGATDEATLNNFYKKQGIPATVSRFFDNLDELYSQSHLVICRAGAGTLMELAMCGRPAILVPYPFAADDHQKKNALVFSNAKAAWCYDQKTLTAEMLADLLRRLTPEELTQRAENMHRLAKPDAARDIVDELEKMICIKN